MILDWLENQKTKNDATVLTNHKKIRMLVFNHPDFKVY
jgi:hypothetical protein